LPYSSSSGGGSAEVAAGATAATGHNTARKCRAQRHLANRHAMRVSGSGQLRVAVFVITDSLFGTEKQK